MMQSSQGTLDFKSVDKITFVGASSNTVIDTTTGSVGIGVDVGGPTSNLHVVGNALITGNVAVTGTGSLTVPSGTTEQRPATTTNGMIRYNSTTYQYEGWMRDDWFGLSVTNGPSLYTFSPNPFTFTTAGNEYGRLGPDLPTITGHSDYSTAAWRTNPVNLSLGHESGGSARPGFQLWTVPSSGTYRITAGGARGGTGPWGHAAYTNTSGPGAEISADFTLTVGTKVIIIVGARSKSTGTSGVGSGGAEAGAGGGGASWVLKENFTTSTNDIYLVAGGGAGRHNYQINVPTSESGGTSQASVSDTGGGETSQGDTSRSAGGGAGWGGDGGGDGWTNSFTVGHTGGYRPAVGAMGGNPSYAASWDGQGGFGGGGSSSLQIAGGGGGFSGGDAAYAAAPTGVAPSNRARGGTSYIMPTGTGGVTVTNPVFIGTHNSHGYVTVQLLL